MRALAHLTYALRQTIPTPVSNPDASPNLSPSPAPHPSLSPHPDTTQSCIPGVGLPGGVYLCGNGFDSCQWISPSQTRKCVSYDVDNLGPPALIGPDFGGWCKMFKNENCEEDAGLRIAIHEGDQPSEDATSGVHSSMGTISCPGIGLENVPTDMKSFQCFPLGMSDPR